MSIASLHIIASRDMGGAERWFLRFLAAMQRHGHAVEACVRRGSALDRAPPAGVALTRLPMRTVWDPLSRWQVSHLARNAQAPIVQTYMGRATRLTHLGRRSGKVHVARLGGYYKLDPFRHADALIGNTRGLCDWMVREGMPASRVHHITNFADPAPPADPVRLAALRERLALRDDDLLLVTLGRFIPVKGHATLLEAFSRLPAECGGRRPRLVLLGDGSLRPALEAQARALGIEARIVWAGWQNDPAPWLHLADLVVFPSRDEETLGNVILEAWAFGKPLVCTAFRGARELARHGDDAWVVPCDDAPALAAGIAAVAGDAALCAAMVAAGARRVRDEYGETAVLAAYQALYARLLGA